MFDDGDDDEKPTQDDTENPDPGSENYIDPMAGQYDSDENSQL